MKINKPTKKLRNGPTLISFDYFEQSIKSGTQMSSDGKAWYPARYISFPSFVDRFKLAYYVFMGYCDAFKWPEASDEN